MSSRQAASVGGADRSGPAAGLQVIDQVSAEDV